MLQNENEHLQTQLTQLCGQQTSSTNNLKDRFKSTAVSAGPAAIAHLSLRVLNIHFQLAIQNTVCLESW